MPELPEVETTIAGLKTAQPPLLGAGFVDVWTDTPKIIKKPKTFEEFKREIRGRKIENIWRRGKNIIFDLSEERRLLIHQKLTGHLLYGLWQLKKGGWIPLERGPLKDKMNSYIRLIFFLDNKRMIAFSDLRKFGKIELWQEQEFEKSQALSSLGPEPLDKKFVFSQFQALFQGKKAKVKSLLMDQKFIVGIGNIYSDEILWEAKINPFKRADKLTQEELKGIYQAMKRVLKKAIRLKGTSTSDYRDAQGEKGLFGQALKAYQRTGQKCFRCGKLIERKKIASRSSHFCSFCQK